MLTWATLYIATAGAVAFVIGQYLGYGVRERQVRSHPLPPGPRGLPWVGNIIGIDTKAPWLTYSEWAKTYGDLMYTRLLGKEVLIISSERVARELLEQRSRNYSDRPYMITNELCGTGFNTGFLPYGDMWRFHRRCFRLTFGSDVLSRFRLLHRRKSCQLLRQLLETPHEYFSHIFDYTTSLIINSAYDYDPPSQKDQLAEIIAKVVDAVVEAVRPEIALILDAFPVLLYLPSWMPGMDFRRKMAVAKKLVAEYVERPFEYALKRLSDVGPAPCMVHDSIQSVELGLSVTDDVRMSAIKSVAATAFIAGSETAASTLSHFLLLMVLNPHIQERAQAQIDTVVGRDRLPTTDDRPSLPYIDAILRELYRSASIVPLSVPRSVLDDDVYAGFYIPKGAMIFINLWSMAHDESRYPEPHEFIPERHLNEDGTLLPDNTEHLAFGFGRRICPGRHFADVSVWSAMASILAVFRISKAKDANGVEVPVDPTFIGGLVIRPAPFVCSIVPRTPWMDIEKLEKLIATTTM